MVGHDLSARAAAVCATVGNANPRPEAGDNPRPDPGRRPPLPPASGATTAGSGRGHGGGAHTLGAALLSVCDTVQHDRGQSHTAPGKTHSFRFPLSPGGGVTPMPPPNSPRPKLSCCRKWRTLCTALLWGTYSANPPPLSLLPAAQKANQWALKPERTARRRRLSQPRSAVRAGHRPLPARLLPRTSQLSQ